MTVIPLRQCARARLDKTGVECRECGRIEKGGARGPASLRDENDE
jgi:hypothetical protein